MSSSFDDRQRAFESKFAHDAEMQFKATSRRNRLIGLWAAELLGRTGQAAEDYAMDIISTDFKAAGHEVVVRKLADDLQGLADEATVRAKMEEFLMKAKASLADG